MSCCCIVLCQLYSCRDTQSTVTLTLLTRRFSTVVDERMVDAGGTGRRLGAGGGGGRERRTLAGGSASLSVRPTTVVPRRRPLPAGRRRLAGKDRRTGKARSDAGRRGTVHLAHAAGRSKPAESSGLRRSIQLAADVGA